MCAFLPAILRRDGYTGEEGEENKQPHLIFAHFVLPCC